MMMMMMMDVKFAISVLLTVLSPARCDRYTVTPTVCSFEPLKSPVSIQCDVGKTDSIEVSATDLPKSVRRLRIVNAGRVRVARNALSVLNIPESIHFENITILSIERNAPGGGLRRGQLSVTVNKVSFVQIKEGAFSHWKEKNLNIRLTNIGNTCVIRSGAIVSKSSSTNVMLENIADGQFFPGTFETKLGRLSLKNVTILTPCQRDTFAGQIGELSLTSVTFSRTIQEGCFQAHQTWSSLKILSCDLDDIPERGFQGRIGLVRIEETRLGKIAQSGFDLDVSSFSVIASSIENLAENALDVRASGGISIERSNITSVSESAFGRLSSSEAGRGISLSQLAITNVTNGSLRFHDFRSLTLRELQIRMPCECEIQE